MPAIRGDVAPDNQPARANTEASPILVLGKQTVRPEKFPITVTLREPAVGVMTNKETIAPAALEVPATQSAQPLEDIEPSVFDRVPETSDHFQNSEKIPTKVKQATEIAFSPVEATGPVRVVEPVSRPIAEGSQNAERVNMIAQVNQETSFTSAPVSRGVQAANEGHLRQYIPAEPARRDSIVPADALTFLSQGDFTPVEKIQPVQAASIRESTTVRSVSRLEETPAAVTIEQSRQFKPQSELRSIAKTVFVPERKSAAPADQPTAEQTVALPANNQSKAFSPKSAQRVTSTEARVMTGRVPEENVPAPQSRPQRSDPVATVLYSRSSRSERQSTAETLFRQPGRKPFIGDDATSSNSSVTATRQRTRQTAQQQAT